MKITISFFIASLFLVGTSCAADQLPSGKWEVTTKTKLSGVPPRIPRYNKKLTICIDNQITGKPPIAAERSCEFSDYIIIQNSASWKMECRGRMKASGIGIITFKDNEYSGNSTLEMEMPGLKPIIVKREHEGKRIGGC